MGNCSPQSAVIAAHEDPDPYTRNKQIDQELIQQSKQDEEKIKLLLLGAGESGKSTIFKQMKIIFGTQYTESERRHYTATIYSNILQAMKVLVEQAILFKLADQVTARDAFELFRQIDDSETINNRMGEALKLLWADPIIQQVWHRRAQFQVFESLSYFMKKVDIVKSSEFVPDKEDIIYSRVRTTGIVTERYTIEGNIFEMYDVGGQRNERRKWIHCFEGVTAVIFVAALSEYDQFMFEDPTKNRMMEALELFDSICNNVYFLESSMILFLNKKDLFAEKIKTKHIRDTPEFADYTGREGDFDAGVQYFLDKFMSKNKSHSHHLYHHITCATDTKNVQVVFNACKDIVLRQNIGSSRFNME
jgi:GTPase SAR1 family protein